MSSTFGNHMKVSVFGQSHSAGIGVVIDGIPAGQEIDFDALQAFLDRRAPGRTPWGTPRKEADAPRFLSGFVGNVICGDPIAAIIENTNARPSDYAQMQRMPRPGHADYTAYLKHDGLNDVSGGGHFSGRLTAPLCIAGGIALQLLERRGVRIGAHLARVAGIDDERFPLQGIGGDLLKAAATKDFPVLDNEAGVRMQEAILQAREEGDSVGGIVECAAVGMPAGLGGPMFDGIENVIAKLCFGIPAVKSVEFGRGFELADMRGSQHNDGYRMQDGNVVLESNNAGGALGGISTGEPIVFRVAFKPTSSIAKMQHTVDLQELCNADISVQGRHDPCVAVRAVPVVEAVCALALLDLLLGEGK